MMTSSRTEQRIYMYGWFEVESMLAFFEHACSTHRYRSSGPRWADFFGRKSFGAIRGNMNLFYTWGAILGPFVAGAIYDQTQSYALVFTGITISLLISTAMTALLIKPWARIGTTA